MQLNSSPYVKSTTMKAPFMAIGDKPVIKAYLGDECVYDRQNAFDHEYYQIGDLMVSRGPLYYNQCFGYQIAQTPYPAEMKNQMFKTVVSQTPPFTGRSIADVGVSSGPDSGSTYAKNNPTSFEYGNYFFNYYELGKVFSSYGDGFPTSYTDVVEIDNQGSTRICCGGFDDWRLPTSADCQMIFLGGTPTGDLMSPINSRSGCTVNGSTGVKSMFARVTVPRGTWWGTTAYTYMVGWVIFPDNESITLSALGTKSNGYNIPFDNYGGIDCNLTEAQLTNLLSSGCTFITTSPIAGYFNGEAPLPQWPAATTMTSGKTWAAQYFCLPASTLICKNLGNGDVAFGGVFRQASNLTYNTDNDYGYPQKLTNTGYIYAYQLEIGVSYNGIPNENQSLSARLVRNVNTNRVYNYISVIQYITLVGNRPIIYAKVNDIGVDFDWDMAPLTNPTLYVNGNKATNTRWVLEDVGDEEKRLSVYSSGSDEPIRSFYNDNGNITTDYES